MDRMSAAELHRLNVVAGEMMATMAADGYNIGEALRLHSAFREGRLAEGGLERSMVAQATRRGAAKAGMHVERPNGATELVSFDALVERHYRLKAGNLREGHPHLLVAPNSKLLEPLPTETDSLLRAERWVLCPVLADDNTIDRVFVAPVLGGEGEKVVVLLLGAVIWLDPITPPDGFEPEVDDDLGEDFEEPETDDDLGEDFDEPGGEAGAA